MCHLLTLLDKKDDKHDKYLPKLNHKCITCIIAEDEYLLKYFRGDAIEIKICIPSCPSSIIASKEN